LAKAEEEANPQKTNPMIAKEMRIKIPTLVAAQYMGRHLGSKATE
jgi:hypothetical protein